MTTDNNNSNEQTSFAYSTVTNDNRQQQQQRTNELRIFFVSFYVVLFRLKCAGNARNTPVSYHARRHDRTGAVGSERGSPVRASPDVSWRGRVRVGRHTI
eukprot:6081228-Prymnesium_polylepis.1